MGILLAGPAGSGKSTLATALLERLVERQYQFCLLDPEGDYEGIEGPLILGNAERVPTASEILQVLQAQNLALFRQIAEGVDDATWLHHLRRRDYERWFRDVIHDEDLAGVAARVADDSDLPAGEGRDRIAAAIARLYTV